MMWSIAGYRNVCRGASVRELDLLHWLLMVWGPVVQLVLYGNASATLGTLHVLSIPMNRRSMIQQQQ